MNIPAMIFAVILAGLVGWQLVTGKVVDRNWRPSITLQENPGMYWFIVIAQGAILAVVLYTGKTSWQVP